MKQQQAYWKWFPAGMVLAGIIVFIFASFGPPASSSGYVSLLKGALEPYFPDYISSKEHYTMLPGTGSWLFTFVIGMAIGGFIAGMTNGKRTKDKPTLWQQRFGSSRLKRYGATFAGGFLILFASRLAGGCTLGLFISGTTQLAISGLYFGVLIFAFAMLSARLVYGKTGRGENDV